MDVMCEKHKQFTVFLFKMSFERTQLFEQLQIQYMIFTPKELIL